MTEEEKWGHTIEKHVTISNDKLLARAAQPVRQTLFETEYRAVRRFTSLESANDLVNQLLERNMVAVDAVASGTMSYAWFEEGFSSPTGEEAIVLDSSGVPTCDRLIMSEWGLFTMTLRRAVIVLLPHTRLTITPVRIGGSHVHA